MNPLIKQRGVRILTIILFFLLGLLAGVLYTNLLGYSKTEGLWTQNIMGYDGDWVHINVDGMNFERCQKVASHECGHELFAEVCEKNMTKCGELAK